MGDRRFADDLEDAQLLVRLWEKYDYGRAQISVFRSLVLLVHAIQLLRALSPDVREPRTQKTYRSVAGISTFNNSPSVSLIYIFDSSHLNIGDLFYNPNPVGILAGGSRRARLTGRHEQPRCDGKRKRVYELITAGFD